MKATERISVNGAITLIGVLVILIVVGASLLPAFVRARATPSAAPCVNNLLQIAGAKESWALENRKTANDTPEWDDIRPFLKPTITCPRGGTYTLGHVGEPPRCSPRSLVKGRALTFFFLLAANRRDQPVGSVGLFLRARS